MTSIRHLGTALLLVALAACSKSNNSAGAAMGTASFAINGQTVTFTGRFDTVSEELVATGIWPGTQDSAFLQLAFGYYDHPFTSIDGQWSDTSSVQLVYGDIIHYGKTVVYEDNHMSQTYATPPNPLVVHVTASNPLTAAGTFSGTMYHQTGTGYDSVMLTNGSFNVKIQ